MGRKLHRQEDSLLEREGGREEGRRWTMDVGPRISRVTPEDRYEFPVFLLATN